MHIKVIKKIIIVKNNLIIQVIKSKNLTRISLEKGMRLKMSKPIVAIIGKPNVGKSTFFNYLAGSRISIVEDTPGVTRDRVYAETNWRGRNSSCKIFFNHGRRISI